jgi:hypothetical protein
MIVSYKIEYKYFVLNLLEQEIVIIIDFDR